MSGERSLSLSSDGDLASEGSSRRSGNVLDEIDELEQLRAWCSKHPWKPQFEPVLYEANPEEPALEYPRMTARGREHERRKLYASYGLGDKEASFYARACSYYPGARYQPLDRALTCSLTPPRLSSSSSDDEASPRFLFKDLPADLPTAKCCSTGNASLNRAGSSPLPKTPEAPPKLPQVSPERRANTGGLVKTPDPRLAADAYRPSPIFDRFKAKRGNRRKAAPTVPPKM